MTDKKYHFKVKYGFGATDYVSIDENDLPKATYALINKTPVILRGQSINGSHIIYIKPDYHKYTGWYESYEPKDAEDIRQIQRDCPPELDKIMELASERVRGLQGGRLTRSQFDSPLLQDVDINLLLTGGKLST